MIGTLEQVVVLKSLDLLGFLKRDGSFAGYIILRHVHGDRETLNAVELVESALSVTRVRPVLNILLEANGLASLRPVISKLQRVVVNLASSLPLSPITDLLVEFRTDFGLVIPPG